MEDGGSCVVQNGQFQFEYFFGTLAAAPDMAGITAMLDPKLQTPQQIGPEAVSTGGKSGE